MLMGRKDLSGRGHSTQSKEDIEVVQPNIVIGGRSYPLKSIKLVSICSSRNYRSVFLALLIGHVIGATVLLYQAATGHVETLLVLVIGFTLAFSLLVAGLIWAAGERKYAVYLRREWQAHRI